MQRFKQAQRLHKEEMLPLDEVAQTLGVSAEKAAQLIGCKTKSLPISALSDTDTDDDPLAWLLLDQHALTPEQAVYRQVCTEELEQLFRTLSAKDRAILGHTYGVFGYEKLSADELGLREMLSPDGVTKARKSCIGAPAQPVSRQRPAPLAGCVSCAEKIFQISDKYTVSQQSF